MDEYDVPVAAASSYGYYDKMLEVIRVIMSSALKDNQALLFAVITGCLKITKEVFLQELIILFQTVSHPQGWMNILDLPGMM